MGAIDERLCKIDLAALLEIFRQAAKHLRKHSVLYPLLKVAMTRRGRRIAAGQIAPRCAGAQHPQDAVHHVARVTPRSATLRARSFALGPRKVRPKDFPLLVGEVHRDRRSQQRSTVDPLWKTDQNSRRYEFPSYGMRSSFRLDDRLQIVERPNALRLHADKNIPSYGFRRRLVAKACRVFQRTNRFSAISICFCW